MLYKYCTTKGFDILLNCRLKAAMFESFNDPFELLFGIDVNTAPNNIQEDYEEYPNIIKTWTSILDSQNIVYDNNSPEDILTKFTEFQMKDFGRVSDDIKEGWKKKIGIVCLSKSYDVIQMWAHYTENHQGIVIGLDKNEFVNDKEALVNVCYHNDMVCLPITGIVSKLDQYVEKNIMNMLSRKEINWAYEQEIRLYVRLEEKEKDGNYYVKIPASSIKSIYLGLRSDQMTKFVAESFKKRKEYRHLKIYKMVRHNTAFKLRSEEI